MGSGLHIDIYNIDMNLRILLFVGGAIMSGLFNVGSNTEEAAFEGELDFTGIVWHNGNNSITQFPFFMHMISLLLYKVVISMILILCHPAHTVQDSKNKS